MSSIRGLIEVKYCDNMPKNIYEITVFGDNWEEIVKIKQDKHCEIDITINLKDQLKKFQIHAIGDDMTYMSISDNDVKE